MSATRNDPQSTTSDDSPEDSSEAAAVADEQRDDDTETELPLDQTFELLKNRRRRAVLEYLREADEDVVSIGELAEYIAAVENDIDVEAVSSSQRKRAYVGLYQCHLPKMDDMDVIEFRKNRGEISRARNADQLERFLDHSHETHRPWYAYYAAIALGGLGVLLVGQLAAGLGGSAMLVLSVSVIGALLVCAAMHARENGVRWPTSIPDRLASAQSILSTE